MIKNWFFTIELDIPENKAAAQKAIRKALAESRKQTKQLTKMLKDLCN